MVYCMCVITPDLSYEKRARSPEKMCATIPTCSKIETESTHALDMRVRETSHQRPTKRSI